MDTNMDREWWILKDAKCVYMEGIENISFSIKKFLSFSIFLLPAELALFFLPKGTKLGGNDKYKDKFL